MMPLKTQSKLVRGETVVITGFGDSLTNGWLVHTGYLDHLARMLAERYPRASVVIHNRGVPGDTARDAYSRLSRDVISDEPDCVLVQFALNDMFSGYTPEEFGTHIERIINRLSRETDADVVIVSSVPLAPLQDEDAATPYYDRLVRIASTRRLAFAAVHSFWKEYCRRGNDCRSLVMIDGVHPTVKGYRIMAEAVMQVLTVEGGEE